MRRRRAGDHNNGVRQKLRDSVRRAVSRLGAVFLGRWRLAAGKNGLEPGKTARHIEKAVFALFRRSGTLKKSPGTMGKRFSQCSWHPEQWENGFFIVSGIRNNVFGIRNIEKTIFTMYLAIRAQLKAPREDCGIFAPPNGGDRLPRHRQPPEIAAPRRVVGLVGVLRIAEHEGEVVGAGGGLAGHGDRSQVEILGRSRRELQPEGGAL